MIAFICKSCGGKQYSAAQTDAPCIYCGKGPVEVEGPAGVETQADRKIVYIAGPITGIPDYKARFQAAADKLRAAGYIPINPTCLPDDLPYSEYFPICLAMIDASRTVYMLSGWQNSRGAQLEFDYAHARGKEIVQGWEP